MRATKRSKWLSFLAVSWAMSWIADPLWAQDPKLMIVEGEHGISSIDPYVSINDAGIVAFTGIGRIVPPETVDTSGAFVVKIPGGPATRVTLTGATRTFHGVAVNSATPLAVATQEEVQVGIERFYLVRKWEENEPSWTWTTIGKSPDHFVSAERFVDINDGGAVAFSAIVEPLFPSTTLFCGQGGEPTPLMIYSLNTAAVRPSMSIDGMIAVRDSLSTPRIKSYPCNQGSPESIAGTWNGFISLEPEPGISEDGSIVSFVGTRLDGTSVFASVRGDSGRSIIKLVDDPDYIHTSQRAGVASRGTRWTQGSVYTGQNAAVVFAGTPTGEPPGIYAAGLFAKQGADELEWIAPGSAIPIVCLGDWIDGRSVSGLTLYDPINRYRTIAVRADFDQGTTGIIRFRPCGRSQLEQPVFTKYKQFWPAGIADKCLIPTQTPPSCTTFRRAGCAICAFATAIAKHIAHEQSSPDALFPLTVRQFLYDNNYLDSDNDLLLETATYLEHRPGLSNSVPQFFCAWAQRALGAPFTFDTIIDELQDGHPVLLRVPNATNAYTLAQALEGHLHFVVAYKYDETLGAVYGESTGILINDPGYGITYYAQPDEAGYVPHFDPPPDLDANVHVNLHDYFATMSRTATEKNGDYYGCWGGEGPRPLRDNERIKEWFNEGHFYARDPDNPGTPTVHTVDDGVRRMLITKVHAATLSAWRDNPYLRPSGTIEVAVKELGGGIRYVSSDDIADPGDVVLGRVLSDFVCSDGGRKAAASGRASDSYRAYALELPPQLHGCSLEVEIIGVDDSEYEVIYQYLGTDFVAPAPLSGSIAIGGVVFDQFNLTAAPCFLSTGPGASLQDHALFVECLSGPGAPPSSESAIGPDACEDAFDCDNDGDVDLSDFAALQRAFTGS